jgi:hypothetical protein
MPDAHGNLFVTDFQLEKNTYQVEKNVSKFCLRQNLLHALKIIFFHRFTKLCTCILELEQKVAYKRVPSLSWEPCGPSTSIGVRHGYFMWEVTGLVLGYVWRRVGG